MLKTIERTKEIIRLRRIIDAEVKRIFQGAREQLDENGKVIEQIATCGECGTSWNDALITSYTPTPSARCPFEYVHQEMRELRQLQRKWNGELQKVTR